MTAKKGKKAASRDKLRALLLGGGGDDLPEGWGRDGDDPGDVDMEITFTPGLSESRGAKDETTLDKYQRKMKEKRRKRKDEVKEKAVEKEKNVGDDFFEVDSGDDESGEEDVPSRSQKGGPKKKGKDAKGRKVSPEAISRPVTTAEELGLLVASDNPNAEPKHFNLKAVLKAEKKLKGKGKRGKKNRAEDENEIQEDFSIDVKDERFKALHEDHTFAIDPSNPQ